MIWSKEIEFNNDGVRALKVPGFDVPIQAQLYYYNNDRFRH